MQKTIVICDDDTWTREFLKDFLAELNHTVFAFENGELALNYLRSYKADLVVSDINMPKMTGTQLIEEINKLSIKIPIIFLTGVIDPTEIMVAYAQNYFEYINKPINPFDLKESVEKALLHGYQESMYSEEFKSKLKRA